MHRNAIINGMCKHWTVNCELTEANLLANVDITLKLRNAEDITQYLNNTGFPKKIL